MQDFTVVTDDDGAIIVGYTPEFGAAYDKFIVEVSDSMNNTVFSEDTTLFGYNVTDLTPGEYFRVSVMSSYKNVTSEGKSATIQLGVIFLLFQPSFSHCPYSFGR